MDKKVKYNSKERQARVEEMEALLIELNEYVSYLVDTNKKLKLIDDDVEKIEKYYYNEWLDDYNRFKSDKNYMVLMQDPIHNVLSEIHEEKIKLLKRIVRKLN